MRVIICTHKADIDGLFSASVALMKFPKSSISFYDYGVKSFRKMFEYIKCESKKTTGGLAIISDLGINDNTVFSLFEETIHYLKKRQWSVIWVDHHPWVRRSLKSVRKYAKLFLNSTGKNVQLKLCMKNSCIRTKLQNSSS